MSEVILNLDFNTAGHNERRDKGRGNAKHKRFVERRRYLERRGFLNKKKNANNIPKEENKKNNSYQKRNRSQASCVFPKFTAPNLELSANPSSSVQAHHENSATLKESTVPSTSKAGFSSVWPNTLKYVALDCEMVGTGPKGHCSELARCSIVSYDGDVIYDKFIKPVNPVTDLRTRWSGIRWKDLQKATPFKQAQGEIVKLLKGKVVVGHAVQNDFKVLHYSHPVHLLRDTSQIPILKQKAGLPENQPPSLKTLTRVLLNRAIQTGKKGHCSVEDAKATMEVYRTVAAEWERTLSLGAAS